MSGLAIYTLKIIGIFILQPGMHENKFITIVVIDIKSYIKLDGTAVGKGIQHGYILDENV
jgi:hypothetical protein